MRYKQAAGNIPTEVVVDLADLADPLMAYEDISDLLSEEQETRLVDYVRALLKMSHDRIRRRYDHWRDADRAHDVWVPADTTKFREKAVIADTRAIADTVLTYMMAALFGRNPMFQLEGLNRRSRTPSLILERLLHQHMRRTAGEARLAQLLLDSIRYGYAPTKCLWNPRNRTNDIVNVDPRRAFPDPRVQWGEWDRMQFVVFADHASTSALIGSGLYPKLSRYPGLRRREARNFSWEAHRWMREEGRGLNVNPQDRQGRESGFTFSLDGSRVVDEAWVRFNGYELNLPQIEQIWMLITILDEEAVIRFQLNPYGRQFPTVFGGLYHDSHKTFAQSLYDILLPLHEVSTWLLRSRIDNVQAALSNLIFVDPTQVSLPDLMDRNPWGLVRTLPGTKPGDGVYIAEVPDVTRSHWGDIAAMSDLKQRLSAASDAQQGMPTSDGIRTATEIARLTQLGSQRLGVLSRIMSATTVRPLVRMMVSNLQDAIEFEGSLRIGAGDSPGQLASLIQEDYVDFDITMLQGDIDYLVVDGSLPIEPTRSAETWLNILQVMHQTGLNMEYKVGKIAEEAIRSMGVSDLDQFKISQEEEAQGPSASQQLSLMEKARGASVMPEEQLMREAERGNVVPMREAM
jgi:hypothetical protein